MVETPRRVLGYANQEDVSYIICYTFYVYKFLF